MKFKEIDPVIHERIRLAVMVYLLQNGESDFNSLKEFTEATEGNLASHLRVLEENKYIEVKKTFVGRRPRTFYKLTKKGKKRLTEYLENLKKILGTIK
jgi:DNA-binding PadR family transcriptional regulator